MAQPIDFETFQNDANRLVKEYISCLFFSARALETERSSNACTDEAFFALFKIAQEMKAKINAEKRFLLYSTIRKIIDYASEFRVVSKKLDAYKFQYWFCESCLELFPTGTESHLARLAMAITMGETLRKDINKGLSNVMEVKIRKTLMAGKLRETFGKYGLYMLYKNCSRICHDACDWFDEMKKQTGQE